MNCLEEAALYWSVNTYFSLPVIQQKAVIQVAQLVTCMYLNNDYLPILSQLQLIHVIKSMSA